MHIGLVRWLPASQDSLLTARSRHPGSDSTAVTEAPGCRLVQPAVAF